MSDLRQQLAELRERVARVNARMQTKYVPAAPALHRTVGQTLAQPEWEPDPPAGTHTDVSFGHELPPIDNWPGSYEVETSEGRHLEAATFYPSHHRHGSADVGALSDLPHDLLRRISEGAAPPGPPSDWAFLDTETTGLAGGSGTCAFLVGVGRITPEGFRVRQFFMRDFAEESSVLTALSEHLAQFRVLITYNGRTFDQPLLETRYRLNRTRPPFANLDHHVDLLYGSRRLWKLRYDSCRLSELEYQVFGVERQGDVPGALIPHLYFEYLRTQRVGRLLPIFYHNATDILSLACLTGIVPHAFNDPMEASAADSLAEAHVSPPLKLRHGSEMVGLARWLRQSGELDQATALFERAIEAGLSDELLFRTLWDMAALARKNAKSKNAGEDQALAIWHDLAASPNPYRVRALEELAKYYEHRSGIDREQDRAQALELTRTALALEDTPELRRRELRLSARPKAPGKRATRKRR